MRLEAAVGVSQSGIHHHLDHGFVMIVLGRNKLKK
jgi:hypothetical protein